MNYNDIDKLVKKHNGWWEGSTARFPTVHDKEQFWLDYGVLEDKDEEDHRGNE